MLMLCNLFIVFALLQPFLYVLFVQLNKEKSPFQRTYATQVCSFFARFNDNLFCDFNLLYSINSLQIKRCGEMARKLRFFKDQMYKAGLSSSKSTYGSVISLDELEVNKQTNGFNGVHVHVIAYLYHFGNLLGKTRRT